MNLERVFESLFRDANENLSHMMWRISKSRAKENVVAVKLAVENLASCLGDARAEQNCGIVVRKSMEKSLQIAYDLDDIVNTFYFQKARQQRCNGFIRCITPFKVSKAHLNLFHAMEQTKENIMAFDRMATTTLQLPMDGEIAESSSSGKHNDEDVGDDVPFQLWVCLFYLSMFPKEMNVPIRRLYHLWNAEFPWQFLMKEIISPGEVGECLAALEKRGMVVVTKSDDGRAKKCRMRGEIYDIFSLKAQKMGVFYIHKKSTQGHTPAPHPQFPVRWVVECADIKDYPAGDDFYVNHLRSYMSFNFQKKDMQALQVGRFVRKIISKRGFALLRVLDLERVYKPQLPEELGNLYGLMYLGLRWTFLDTLPSSVANLKHLHTLDIKHTYIRSIPISNWSIDSLRHLYLNQISLPIAGHIRYNDLETLSGLFMDKKLGLIHLRSLKRLSLTCHSSSAQELGVLILSLPELQSLKLRSIDDHEMGKPSSLHLVSLWKLRNLTNLYLMGNLEKSSLEFPPSLRDLTLSVSRLEDDPMPTLGQLPNLIVLRLLAHSYTGNKMVCEQGKFVSLQVLKLWVLENLEEWVVEKGAMQSLKKLEVRGCVKLKSLPAPLLNSSPLEELTLTNMPKEFVVVAEAKRQKQTSMKTANTSEL